MVVRYKRSRGFDVVDRAGYDTQGLPAEHLVEKKLKLASKRDIEEKIGIELFIKTCKEEIDYYIGMWKNDFERFGVSLDFSKPYLPHSNEYMEGEWALFKTINERGYLYHGKKTTAYCPHCECVVSQGSMEVEHSDEKDPSIFITFKVDNAKSSKAKVKLNGMVYLLVWTTTPWTVPANVSVAMNPDGRYVVARIKGKDMILAKDRLDYVSSMLNESAVVLQEFYGSELINVYYTNGLEAKVPKQKELRKYHKILPAPKLVSNGEGTGLVHIAPGHGLKMTTTSDDREAPHFCPVGADANYTEDAGAISARRCPNSLMGWCLKTSTSSACLNTVVSLYTVIPHCWRCHSKVIFIATPQ